LFINPLQNAFNKTLYLIEVQFFPYLVGQKDGVDIMCIPGEIFEPQVLTYYYYYPKNNSFTSVEDVQYSYIGTEQNNEYILAYDNGSTSENIEKGYEKIRSITASESNRFNLL